MSLEYHQMIAILCAYAAGWLVGYTMYRTIKDLLS